MNHTSVSNCMRAFCINGMRKSNKYEFKTDLQRAFVDKNTLSRDIVFFYLKLQAKHLIAKSSPDNAQFNREAAKNNCV